MASAIRRPNSSVQSTGELAQLAALGVIVAGPVQIFACSPQIPAVYPTSDLFLAPFLAHMAADVDASLTELNLQNDSAIFLGTFGALFVTSMALSGVWCLVAGRSATDRVFGSTSTSYSFLCLTEGSIVFFVFKLAFDWRILVTFFPILY